MIDVTFQHWRYQFPDEELIRYGSPHFDQRTAGLALSAAVRNVGDLVSTGGYSFDPKLILSANEVFPEAAVADPLADLEVWDEWRSGIRSFPYPGRYGRLGIRQQEAKTSSTSSTGVLGEIMAGLLAQAGIAPWVLVRVIRRWPDFIFYLQGDRYAFVEAKAYTGESVTASSYALRVPDALLGECVVDAVHQLNADPFVQVWGSFTHVVQISPMRLHVTLLELDVGDDRRMATSRRVVPHAVLLGIAERALRKAVIEVDPEELIPLQRPNRKPSKFERKHLESILIPASMRQLENLLSEEGVRTAVLTSPELVEDELKKMIRYARIPEHGEGEKIQSAREKAAPGILSHVRTVGAQALYVGDIGPEERATISAQWTPDWSRASRPWKTIGQADIWRCGGAFFAIGDKELEGLPYKTR